MTIVNTHQSEAWNGYEGTHWADHHDRYDATNSGFNHHLLQFASEDDRVLDVGCGSGQVTRLAARRARHATGLDLSAPMLSRARALASEEGIGNVDFQQGDAQVHPLPAGTYDLAVSRFGIMFFADPVAAFANIGRALRPGGRVAFLGMRDLADHDLRLVFETLAEHLPPPPPSPDGTSPTSLSDPAHVHEVFTAAGFTQVEATPVEAEQVLGTDAQDAAAFLAAWGPVRYLLGRATPAAAARATAALAPALAPYERDGAVRLRGAARLITAVRP
ncbi:class I SAM-dependent methyltransferase [Nonomuraea sp. LPB2021202275-12-8]|uniref:class I SAM-dependent methyltransferase n=1 Tax=Nonomuraea sp. LPB2021202275-12-8 TaxID=3120159 RepID=UPI00300CCEB6